MSDTDAPVAAASVPQEVLRLLQLRDELNAPALMINILDEQTSAQRSSIMQNTSVGKRLGLYVLDDANDSNPYCYISRGVTVGMVVHFNHDPEPKIEFETARAFEAFLRELRARDQELGSVEASPPTHPNQIALAASLCELARSDDEDSEFLLCLYVPLLRGEHERGLGELVEHKSFLVRESIADAAGIGHLSGCEAALRSLASDPHPQVRCAALRASKKLGHLRRDAQPLHRSVLTKSASPPL